MAFAATFADGRAAIGRARACVPTEFFDFDRPSVAPMRQALA